MSAGLLNGTGGHGVDLCQPIEAAAAAEAADLVDPAEQRVRAPPRQSRPSLSELFPGLRASSLGAHSSPPLRGGPPQLAKLSLPAMPSSPGARFFRACCSWCRVR